MIPILFGGVCGFLYFLYKLEAPGMGGILFRVDSSGIINFSLDSLLGILYAPFKYISFWTDIDLYSVNWIITTFIGGLLFYIIDQVFIK